LWVLIAWRRWWWWFWNYTPNWWWRRARSCFGWVMLYW
jgi:hypothetical protein